MTSIVVAALLLSALQDSHQFLQEEVGTSRLASCFIQVFMPYRSHPKIPIPTLISSGGTLVSGEFDANGWALDPLAVAAKYLKKEPAVHFDFGTAADFAAQFPMAERELKTAYRL